MYNVHTPATHTQPEDNRLVSTKSEILEEATESCRANGEVSKTLTFIDEYEANDIDINTTEYLTVQEIAEIESCYGNIALSDKLTELRNEGKSYDYIQGYEDGYNHA